jgi:hypothetical protein
MGWVNSVTTNTSGIGGVDARSAMDNSGWVISTGGSRADGGDRSQGVDAWGGPLGTGLDMQTVLMIAAGVAIVALLLRRKRA